MQKKTWTILICAYNCADTIKDTLNSIIYDGNDDLDVLVVDDGSKQDIKSIVQPFVDAHPNIVHYFRKENGNQGSCINFAISKANSRYLSLLDSDDTYRKEDFQTVLNSLRNSRPDTDLVLLNFDMLFTNKKFRKVSKSKISTTTKEIEYKPFNKMSLFRIITIHSSIYSLDLLKKIDKLPENVGYSDNMLYLEVMMRVNNVAYLNKNIHLYQYFIRGENQAIYTKSLIDRFNDILIIYDRMLQIKLSQFGKDRVKVAKKIIGNHIYWIMAILGNSYKIPTKHKPAIIKDVYARLHEFEKANNCKMTPGLVKLLQKNRYGGIYVIRNFYKWIPIDFLKATRYTKQGKKEAKQLKKSYKEQFKKQG